MKDGTMIAEIRSLQDAYKQIEKLTNKLTDNIIAKQWTVDWPSDQESPLSVSANTYNGYQFIAWINFTSNGVTVPLHTSNSLNGNKTNVFCYNTSLIKGKRIDCVALYQKV